jgi:hypothetical protein
MGSFFKDFQRGYRLVSKHQRNPSPHSIRFSYLAGIPQSIPRAQIIKTRIKQTLLKRLPSTVLLL